MRTYLTICWSFGVIIMVFRIVTGEWLGWSEIFFPMVDLFEYEQNKWLRFFGGLFLKIIVYFVVIPYYIFSVALVLFSPIVFFMRIIEWKKTGIWKSVFD